MPLGLRLTIAKVGHSHAGKHCCTVLLSEIDAVKTETGKQSYYLCASHCSTQSSLAIASTFFMRYAQQNEHTMSSLWAGGLCLTLQGQKCRAVMHHQAPLCNANTQSCGCPTGALYSGPLGPCLQQPLGTGSSQPGGEGAKGNP